MFLPHPLSLAPVGRLPTTGVLAKGFGHSLLARPVVSYCIETLKTRGISAQAERSKHVNSWKLVLNTSDKNGPTDQRDDHQQAKRTHERLYEEHGKGNTRLHHKDQVRQRRSQQFTGSLERTGELVRSPKITSVISGNFICRHHVEPRVKLYSPREGSSPIPLKYIDVTRATRTLLDVMLEKSINDHWNVYVDWLHKVHDLG